MSKPNMRMKLLVDKTKRKVLFAEAGKDCVSFLFHILSLPLGSVMNLLMADDSVQTPGSSEVPLLTIKPATKSYYTCCNLYHRLFVSDAFGAFCPLCNLCMSTVMAYVGRSSAHAKKEVTVTYMIMDNLTVQPMSTISGIKLLTKFDVQDVGRLEEKLVILDMNLGLSLLKASLTSKTVLTDTFLPKKVSTVS